MREGNTATSGSLSGLHGYGSAAAAAEVSRSGAVAHRTSVAPPSREQPGVGRALLRAPAVPLAAALLLVWLLVDPHTPDLAAQVYRANLFSSHGFVVWDARWYAGHEMLGYSLLFPPLAALLGVRAVGALSALASAFLFERIVGGRSGGRSRGRLAAASWFAVAAVGDVWAGRITFALGVALALAAVLALERAHPLAAGVLALACAAASPVAGALLALGGVSLALVRRSPRELPALVLAPGVLVVALALLFGEGGWEPYPFTSFLATVVVVGTSLFALPRSGARLGSGPAARVRSAGVLYLFACVLSLLLRSPMGSNVERYGVLLAGPVLLLCAGGPRVGVRARGRVRPALVVALCASAVWTVWGPARETLAVAGSEATTAAYYAPLERFLAARGPVRVEVPLTRSHWEAALLAPSVSLARGWEKQLEERYARPLLSPGPTAVAYDRWLHELAVSYVALPDARLDGSSAREGQLIRDGLPFLREVFASAHWRVYAVVAATPIASGPGSLTALAHDSFRLAARAAGSFLVRVHFSRYLAVVRGNACVRPAPRGWTRVSARASGSIEVAARFSLARAFGSGGGSCGGA